MSSEPTTPPVSKAAFWTGIVLTTLPVLLLLFSAIMKLAQPPGLSDGFTHMGLPLSMATGLGILEIACTLVYLLPRTAVIGAILLTGYLGGAILTHLRVGDQVYSHVVMGIMIWGGVYLREPRLRALIPCRSK